MQMANVYTPVQMIVEHGVWPPRPYQLNWHATRRETGRVVKLQIIRAAGGAVEVPREKTA